MRLIVAVNNDYWIGLGDRLPWHCPEDMQWFMEQTIGHNIVMGRRTFESFDGFLKDRFHIVFSKTLWIPDNTLGYTISNWSEVPNDAWIIGGASIYAQALVTGRVREIVMTHIDDDTVGDTKFPLDQWDLHNWKMEWGPKLSSRARVAYYYA